MLESEAVLKIFNNAKDSLDLYIKLQKYYGKKNKKQRG